MRVITNRSTGEMGRRLAAAFVRRGARVTLLEGIVSTSRPLPAGIKVRPFCFFDELQALLKEESARSYDVIVHAAAVSDFRVSTPAAGKVPSGQKLTLDLVPTAKLLNTIKNHAPDVFLVGFKFEPQLDHDYIHARTRALFDDAGCDIVVANRQSSHGYEAFLLFPDGRESSRVSSKAAITRALINEIYHSRS